jgi:hypothetical protein
MYSSTHPDTSIQRQKKIEKEVIKAATEFPNPLEDICGHEEIDGGNKIYYTVDEKISNIPSIEMVNKSHTRANILKNHRCKFYYSITIMEKSIVTRNKMAAPNACIDIQTRARDTLKTLTRITEELKAYGFQNSTQEIKSYVNYFSRLRTLVAKIDNIIETEAMNDPDMLKELLTMYMMEEDAFSQGISMQDLTNRFNSNLGASSDMNSTKHGENLKDGDDEDEDQFADATQKPEDSDEEQETIRENPGKSRSYTYEPQFNRSQGIYNPAPPLPNIHPRQHAGNGGQRGPGGPGRPPPPGGQHEGQPPYVPPWGPPPPQRPQQQQQYFPYPPLFYVTPIQFGQQRHQSTQTDHRSNVETNTGPQINDEYRHYVENTRTGQRYTETSFQTTQIQEHDGNQASGNQGRTFRSTEIPKFSQENPFGRIMGGLNIPPALVCQYNQGQCSCCRRAHNLLNCPKFKTLTTQLQSAIIRRYKICFHCLLGVHYTRDCKKDEGKKCGIDGCDRYHHKVLHRDPKSINFIGRQIEDECNPKQPPQVDLISFQD